jgi:hypothetical protein
MRRSLVTEAITSLLLCLAGLSCASTPDMGVPKRNAATPEVQIENVEALGIYRAADVRGVAGTMRFYFAAGGTCEALLHEGRAAFYLPEGRFGRLAANRAGPRCEPVGVASLAAWRDRLPVRRSRYLQPREKATLRPAGSAPGVILARGSFPLAIELLMPHYEDLVAVLPDDPTCRAILAARTAMLEYWPEGPQPLMLRLRRGEEACPLLGLALPLTLD